jgi:hypothetical protein
VPSGDDDLDAPQSFCANNVLAFITIHCHVFSALSIAGWRPNTHPASPTPPTTPSNTSPFALANNFLDHQFINSSFSPTTTTTN